MTYSDPKTDRQRAVLAAMEAVEVHGQSGYYARLAVDAALATLYTLGWEIPR